MPWPPRRSRRPRARSDTGAGVAFQGRACPVKEQLRPGSGSQTTSLDAQQGQEDESHDVPTL